MRRAIDVSVIIVSYNTKDILLACIQRLMQSHSPQHGMEIIVVDNASSDGSLDALTTAFPGVQRIAESANVGFAAANNHGIRVSRGRYILLLNSDTFVEADTVERIVAFMDHHPRVGAATCVLRLPDGRIDPACHRGFPTLWASFTYFAGLERLFPRSRRFGQYHLGYADMTSPHEIDSPSGAFMLVRRSTIDEVGLLDEDYFMYAEDIDWAYRMKQRGWRVMFTPEVSAVHLKKQSGRSNQDAKRRIAAQIHFFETMKTFYLKHYRMRYPALVNFLVQSVLLFRITMLKHLSL